MTAAMRCCICRRPLAQAFAWTLFRAGDKGLALPSPVGPACARKTRLVSTRAKRTAPAFSPRQMDLIGATS